MDNKLRNLNWVLIEDISPILINTLIETEDKRFYTHSGVDYIALGSGLGRYLTFQNKRGASTITMQLVALLNTELKPVKGSRTFSQKWSQIWSALEIEKTWSKSGILEAYLNLVTYRGELVGLKAAARGLLDKDTDALDQLDSLLLVSLLKIPVGSIKKVSQRACYISKKMTLDIKCETIQDFVEEKLSKKYQFKTNTGLIPHLARKILSESQNSSQRQFYTTIDYSIQSYSIEVLKQHLSEVRKQNVKDGAVLVVENRTGNILTYIGSSGEFSESPAMDAIQSRRQAGSTLKPFLYALALEKKIITPDTMIDDSPVEFSVGTGIYKPSNYQDTFHGKVKVSQALASSLNVPAVKILSLTGIEGFIEKLKELGIKELKSADHYGLSSALGSPDVTLWELTNAFRTLGNGGEYTELKYLKEVKPTEKRKVYAKGVTDAITEILSNRENRILTFGLENPLSTRYKTAVKTGTSKDMRDNWCIGYSDYHTVGVWVGNFSGKPMWNVSGVTGAAPIWIDIMNHLSTNYPAVLKKKEEVKNQKSSERILPIQNNSPIANKIISPVHGTIIAIDPDIPEDRQYVFFESRIKTNLHYWYLDNQKLDTTSSYYLWKPSLGKHRLEIKNQSGEVVSHIIFEVR